ncbi:MAG: biotin--[acetyl-CoA-carboxylase] ligase [Phycisphaerales bacterium]|nr:biotin--[acetyl-CoA-carboxylase] ligase [Phycisphaerales bacterium]
MSVPEDITAWPDRLESAAKGTIFDRIVVLSETASTQDAAARACIGLPKDHPATLVVASNQTMGRGQRANNWHDAVGLTLPSSFAIGSEFLSLNNPNLAARAGLAALDTVQHFANDYPIKIKWPNDILATKDENFGGKIAGVLIEHSRDSIVIGIGINCLQTEADLHPSIKDTAISLKQLGCDVQRIDLACKLIESLNHWFNDATEDHIRQHWKQHDALVGLDKKFIYNNQPTTGTVLSIDPLKEIRVQTSAGERTLPVEQTRLISK